MGTPARAERWFLLAYGFWLFGVFAYFLPAATWNPVSRFDLTRALVEQRSLSIDAYADNTGDRALYDGRWYTEKPPMPSLLAVPAYAIFHAYERLNGRRPDHASLASGDVPARRVLVNDSFQRGLYVCSLATAGIGAVLSALVLFELLRRRFSTGAAFFGSTCAVLATPLLPYATSFYGHAVAGAFLVAAVGWLALSPDATPSRWRVRGAGACLMLAAGSEYVTSFPAAAIAAAWLVMSPRAEVFRRALDLAIGALPPAVLVGGYHYACFGAPWRTGYQFVQRQEFARGHAAGLFGLHPPTLEGAIGLLVGERRGLLFVAPFLAIAIAVALWHAYRSRDPAARLSLVAIVTLFVVNAGYYMWWGGAAAGPRHLVPILGFFAFGAAAAWQRPALRWLLLPLVAISGLNALALTAVGLEAPERGNLLFDYAYPRLVNGEIATMSGASNLGLRAGFTRAGTLGPLLVWLLFGMYFLVRRLDAWVAPHTPSGQAPGAVQLALETGPSSPASSGAPAVPTPAEPPVPPPLPPAPAADPPAPPVDPAVPPVAAPPVPPVAPPVPVPPTPPLLASGRPPPNSRSSLEPQAKYIVDMSTAAPRKITPRTSRRSPGKRSSPPDIGDKDPSSAAKCQAKPGIRGATARAGAYFLGAFLLW